jgi:hypothetical protein
MRSGWRCTWRLTNWIDSSLGSGKKLTLIERLDMIVNSWFSTEEEEDADKPLVHHHNLLCKAGKAIAKNHRRYGTDNRPLCEECARLDAEGR